MRIAGGLEQGVVHGTLSHAAGHDSPQTPDLTPSARHVQTRAQALNRPGPMAPWGPDIPGQRAQGPDLRVAVRLEQGVVDGALGNAAGRLSRIAQHPERRSRQVVGALQDGVARALEPQACSSASGTQQRGLGVSDSYEPARRSTLVMALWGGRQGVGALQDGATRALQRRACSSAFRIEG